jgi:hypothetical protein
MLGTPRREAQREITFQAQGERLERIPLAAIQVLTDPSGELLRTQRS